MAREGDTGGTGSGGEGRPRSVEAEDRPGRSRRRPRTFARAAVSGIARGMAPYVGLAAGVYFAAAVLGAAAGVDRGSSLILPIREGAPALGRFSAWDFFAHNAPIAAVMALGFLAFGLPTLYLLAFNGFALGSALTAAVDEFGVVTTAAAVLPHAVFELPGVWLAAAVGFRWVHVVWRVASGELNRPVLVHVRETLAALVVALALVAVAAWVEATVTDEVIRLASRLAVAGVG